MKRYILIVDDDETQRMLYARALRSDVMEPTPLASAEACELVLERLDQTDMERTLVLMDVTLRPDDKYPDGCAAGRRFARRWPGLKVVFMTGHGEEELLKRCPGHPPYIVKPMPVLALAALVRIHHDAPAWIPPKE